MNFLVFPILVAGFSSQAGIIVAVGAQNAFIIRQGIMRSYIPQILAICIGADVLLIGLGTQGMSSVVTSHPAAMAVFTWLGAALLLGYGIMAFARVCRRARTMSLARRGMLADGSAGAIVAGGEIKAPKESSLKRTLMLCLGFTFLNPSVYLDTFVLLGGIAATYGGALKWSFAMGAMCCSVVWFLLLGLLSSKMSRLFNNDCAWLVLDAIIGITMVLLSIHLAMR
ncbi:LysE/ArgO family amino acid transporter [Bifidobacterium sp.]|jgi:L-lysine exporter family protein LysE/ArgO|uniref:LysE/ArgO family amino acid transporter n=1 Tax=Bifidobacterium sp. TaxID=41200 RepID=UPI0025BA479A|nr:LysE family transporter [Bifidobacterium sp.]MCH4210062.1 LysE family transporter [Bifidobacterium sp.]